MLIMEILAIYTLYLVNFYKKMRYTYSVLLQLCYILRKNNILAYFDKKHVEK